MSKKVALKYGQFSEVDDKDVQYEFEGQDQFFSPSLSLLPFQNAVSSARGFYAEKFVNQSLPLKNPEAPYVQALKDKDTNESYNEYLGKKLGTVFADDKMDDPTITSFEITSVTPDEITYKDNKGNKYKKELYNNFVFNRKSSLHNTPLVKKGDIVEKGKILAKTNYTDDNGVLAVGVNARTAIIPYKGWTMDDAVVISEDFAKKLSSHQVYKFNEDDDKNIKTGKSHYTSLFPDKYTKDKLSNIDDNGVIKPGSLVKEGDPLILSTKPKMISSKDSNLGNLSKYLKNTRTDATTIWDHPSDGIVTDVIKGRDGWKVIVETYAPAKRGDKLSQRSGNKSTISDILPMNKMPRGEDGKPFDILINPLSLVSRVNSALIYETLLGKIAEKTGKVYKIPSFNTSKEKWYDFVKSELEKANVNDVEEIYDPELDRKLENKATTGNLYIHKLHHTGESKLSARGQGAYSLNKTPLRGGDEAAKAKRIGGLSTFGLLSAGAYNVLKDSLSLRGQQNDEYWRAVRLGQTPELAKKSPFVWDKYLALLKGAGFNTIDKGNGKLRLAPFSDKALDNLNPIELKNAEIVDFKTLKPVENGLFDPATTITNKWAKITLSEPIINPPFENMVASLLGVKKSDLHDIMIGKKDLENFGSGTIAIKKALENIDMKKMFNESYQQFKSGPKTNKQKALNRMNYIKGLLRNEMEPKDLIITKLPVIPAAFRPYSAIGDTFIPGDINELYKEVFNVNQAHKELSDELGKDDSMVKEDIMNLYKSIKSLYGIEETENKKLKQRNVSGFLQKLTGGTSKFSYVQRMLNSKDVDFTGRAVIGPNPELSIDEVGIPYDMAWKIFSPYIQRELSRNRGMSLVDSVKAIENRTDVAKQALEQVVKENPVIYTRDPSWHKQNALGGWAKLHDGKNILINPIVASGLNADYDGDYQIGYVILAIPKS